MSKKLSKFGKLGKIGTAISTMLLTSMLHCNATTFQQKADVKLTTPNAKYLSVGKTTKSYKQASSQYKSQKSFDTLFNILNSDLNKMTDYTILEADVQKKLAEMYAQMNANSLDLACAFKAFEYNTFIDSGLSLEEAIEISENRGDGTDDKVDAFVGRGSLQHFMHLMLDTQTLNRLNAEEAEIQTIDEIDGKNEFFKLNKNGNRNIIEDSSAVLNSMEKYILAYAEYEYAISNENKDNINVIKQNLSSIKELIVKRDFNTEDKDTLTKIINETADLLPENMFGTTEMRRGLLAEIVKQHVMNNMLEKLIGLNYDVNINPELLAEQMKKTNGYNFTPSLTANISNTDSGFGIGITTTKPFKDDWDMIYGLKLNTNFNSQGSTQQALGSVDFAKNLKKNQFSIGLTAGGQLDSQGASLAVGMQTGYCWKINDKFSVDFGINLLSNIQRSIMNIGTTIGLTYRTNSGMLIKFGANLGYNLGLSNELGKGTGTTIVPPIYGEDQVQKPGDTTNAGNIQDLPENKIDDISKY